HVLFGDATTMLALFIMASVVAWVDAGGVAATGERTSDNRMLFIIVSVAFVAVIATQVRGRSRSLRLLRNGRVSYGTLVTKELMPRRNEDAPQWYLLSFRFEDRGAPMIPATPSSPICCRDSRASATTRLHR
ncbi:MAG: hypothetical protein LC659_09355, partial [Myxococcales bacterium]|nr:hypothetical protein [Myxococcales bacterium]